MKAYNYSIIIPHKNIFDLLQRCLSSIPERDDTEIIIIDDNSAPEKTDFDNFPGKNRKNTEIIFSKKGGGAGFARNIGLSRATGKWLLFADADDYFNGCLDEILNDYIDDNTADMIFFRNGNIDGKTGKPLSRTKWLNDFMDIYFRNPGKGEILLKYLFVVPWAKLIKRNIITFNAIQFDETIINNDISFSCLCGFHSRIIKADKREMYCHVYRENSLSQSADNPDTLMDSVYVHAKSLLFYKNINMGIHLHKVQKKIYNDLMSLRLASRRHYINAKKMLLNMGFTKFQILAGIIRAFIRRNNNKGIISC